jgi:hypothetical protein
MSSSRDATERLINQYVSDYTYRKSKVTLAATTAPQLFMQANPRRHGFLVNHYTAVATYIDADPNVGVNNGIILGNGTLLRWWLCLDGAIIFAPWYANTNGATDFIILHEYLVT